MELSHERQMPAHLPHSARELTHGSEHRLVLEVAQHMVAVVNGFHLAQRPVEEAREVVLLAAGGERGHDLIETQVGEEIRLARHVAGIAFAAVEQDAPERGRRDCLAAIR